MRKYVVLGLVIMAIMMSGCTKEAASSTPSDQEKKTLSILAPPDGDLSRDDNLFTKELEEKMDIEIVWNIAPAGDFKQKMNLMFASGELTDIIATGPADRIDKTTEALLGAQGLIIPLNKYLDTISVGYKEAFEKLEGLREFITTPDGNIYSLSNVDGSLHIQYFNKLWINTVWLDNLGLSMPKTTDEFYRVLKAFKEKDANGNGNPDDEIPLSTIKFTLSSQIDGFLMSPFILTPQSDRLWVDRGKIVFSPVEPGYKDGLRYLNRLYSEGLLYPESFTQDVTTQVNLNESGDEPVIGAFLGMRPGFACDLKTLPNSKKWEQYQSLAPLAGPDGEVVAPWNPYAQYQTGIAFITKGCENPELAFRLIDYIATPEGTLRTAEGVEGNGWRKATEGEKGLDGRQATITQLTEGKEPNSGWGQLCGLVRTPDFVLSYSYPQDPYAEDVIPLVGRQIPLYKGSEEHAKVRQSFDSILPELYYSEDQIEEMSLLKTTIDDNVKSSLVRFITGDLSIEKDWDSYIGQMKELGLERYLEIIQDAYDISSFKK